MSQTKTSLMGPDAFPSLSLLQDVFLVLVVLQQHGIAGFQLGLWEISIIWGLGVALAVYLTARVPLVLTSTRRSRSHSGCLRALNVKKLSLYCCTNVRWFFAAAVVLCITIYLSTEQVNGIVRGITRKPLYCGRLLYLPTAQISVIHAFFIEVIIAVILVGLILALTDDGNGVPSWTFSAITYRYSDCGYRWCIWSINWIRLKPCP